MSKSKLSVHEMLFEELWEESFPDIDLYRQQQIIQSKQVMEYGGYRFKPWLFVYDYVSYEGRVVIELNGQIYQKGGHNSPRGLLRDYTKMSKAASEGWMGFSLAPPMIGKGWLRAIASTIQSRI